MFQRRYGMKYNSFKYSQVISAIPSALQKKTKERARPNVTFLSRHTLNHLNHGPHETEILRLLLIICKESQLREFYLKLIHRIVVTKKVELSLSGIT